jgi:hypothetical protein
VIEVEATFTQDGSPRPQKVFCDAAWLLVESIGRSWTSEAGRHVLTRVSDGRVFELVYDGVGWQGKIVSAPPGFA